VFTTQAATSWRPDQNACKLNAELDTRQTYMAQDRGRRITMVIVGLVLATDIVFAVTSLALVGGADFVSNVIRIGLTALLAWQLYLGRNWARLVFVALLVAGAALGCFYSITLFAEGGLLGSVLIGIPTLVILVGALLMWRNAAVKEFFGVRHQAPMPPLRNEEL
jgi:hypothetical protein